MNPRDFYELASNLAANNNAAHLRTAVSRAYYAAYNTGVEILEKMGFTIKKSPEGHADVRMCLNNSGNTEVEEAASKLSTLSTQRIHADYRLNKVDVENPKTVEALIKDANNIIAILDSCISEPKRSQIIKSIKEWEEKTGKVI